MATAEDCQIICQQTDQCRYWTHGHPGENYVYSGKCFMKYTKGNVGPLIAVTSGARNCSGKFLSFKNQFLSIFLNLNNLPLYYFRCMF